MTGVATIGNGKSYTVFRYGDHVIRAIFLRILSCNLVKPVH